MYHLKANGSLPLEYANSTIFANDTDLSNWSHKECFEDHYFMYWLNFFRIFLFQRAKIIYKHSPLISILLFRIENSKIINLLFRVKLWDPSNFSNTVTYPFASYRKSWIKSNLEDFPNGPMDRRLHANAGNRSSIPGPGRSHMSWGN